MFGDGTQGRSGQRPAPRRERRAGARFGYALPVLATFGLALALGAGAPVQAQDFTDLSPAGAANAPSDADLRQVSQAPAGVEPQGQPVGPALQIGQLIFVGGEFQGEEAVRRGQAGIGGRAVEVIGFPLLDDPEFRTLIQPFIGRSFGGGEGIESLNTVLRETIAYLREQDRPVVDALIPQQDFGAVGAGAPVPVIIQVVEGEVGRLEVEGNEYFADEQIAGAVRANNGDPIDSADFAEDLRFVNSNYFRNVDLVYRPGPTVGSTDVVLRTRDRLPLRVFSSYSNTGSEATGLNRYSVGLNAGDLFALGHQLDYSYTFADNPANSSTHFIAYTIPLPWLHRLVLTGTYGGTEADLDAFFRQTESRYGVSATYFIPLPQPPDLLGLDLDDYQHEFALGYEYSRSDSELAFDSAIVSQSAVEENVFNALYQATYRQNDAILSLALGLRASPGGLTSENDREAFEAARPFSSPSNLVGNARMDYSNFLWDSDVLVDLRLRGQLASTNLQDNRRFSIAGAYGVRGFDDGEYTGDSGFVANLEVYTPETEVLGLLFDDLQDPVYGGRLTDSLRGLAFIDYGYADVHTAVATDPHPVDIASAGIGLRYNIFPWVNLRADYAWEIGDYAGDGTDDRLHLLLTVGN
jgi:hemolysin activation/secretion protein